MRILNFSRASASTITQRHYNKLSDATYPSDSAVLTCLRTAIRSRGSEGPTNILLCSEFRASVCTWVVCSELTEGYALIGHSMKRTRFLDGCSLLACLIKLLERASGLGSWLTLVRLFRRLHQFARQSGSPLYIRASVTGCLRSPMSTRFHWSSEEARRVPRKNLAATDRVKLRRDIR